MICRLSVLRGTSGGGVSRRRKMSEQKTSSLIEAGTTPFAVFASAMAYTIDAAQRSVLFWDVLRQRGNQYREHMAKSAPHVLDYKVELVADGRKLERPVNYAL